MQKFKLWYSLANFQERCEKGHFRSTNDRNFQTSSKQEITKSQLRKLENSPVEIDSILSSLLVPGDVVELVEGGDVVDVVHPLHALQVDELVVALVEVEELAVALLVTKLDHVVGIVSTRLPNLLKLIKLY